MNWAEAIVVIIIATSLAKVVSTALTTARHRSHDAEPAPPEMQTPEIQALRREVDDLRARVRVLERIATDDRKSRDLSDEIERLR